MVQVPTQTFVDSFLTGFVVCAFWWYVICKTIDTLIRFVEVGVPHTPRVKRRVVKHLD